MALVTTPRETAMTTAHQTRLFASLRCPRPSVRATALTTPPPTAPCEIAPTSDSNGKTSETPAKASTLTLAMK
jgi:hypothetical protein